MNYLPWRIPEHNPGLILDTHGCLVVNLTHFCIGDGQNSAEIAQFLVAKANDLTEKELQERNTAKAARRESHNGL